MDYEMEELVPIVGKLAEKYTSHESTSITYEKAEQLAILQREDLSKEQMEELFFDLSPYSRNKKKQTLQW